MQRHCDIAYGKLPLSLWALSIYISRGSQCLYRDCHFETPITKFFTNLLTPISTCPNS